VYVAAGGSGVYRVTKDNKLVSWLQKVGVAQRVSVTSDGRIVVLIATHVQGSEGSQAWRGRVEVYNSAGVRLTILKLPHDISNPWHVVQTVNRSFIISHGDKDTQQNRVCEVNNEGIIVASYGGPPGSGLRQLHLPVHLALDNKERVIVADCFNQRVLLLDRRLNIQRVLLSWSTESRDAPLRLVCDSDKSQLLVGLYSGRTEIYKL